MRRLTRGEFDALIYQIGQLRLELRSSNIDTSLSGSVNSAIVALSGTISSNILHYSGVLDSNFRNEDSRLSGTINARIVNLSGTIDGAITALSGNVSGTIYRLSGSVDSRINEVSSSLASAIAGVTSRAFPFVDLRQAPYGVVADDVSAASANTVAINQAIVDYNGDRAALMLPQGTIYIDQAAGGANYSIVFDGATDIELIGQGPLATMIVQNGAGDLGDWHAIAVQNGATRIGFRNFGIMQGTITNPESGQQNHLINLRAVSADVVDVYGDNLYFGKCLGDALAFVGTTNFKIRGSRFSNLVMRLSGTVHASRVGARTGISFQKGYEDVAISNFDIAGAQNSAIDMESTGNGTMNYAQFENGYIDNTAGNSATAMTFSGVGNGANSKYPRMNNIIIREGNLYIGDTENAVVENVTVIMEATRPNSPDRPLLLVRNDNKNLRLRDVRIHRLSGSGDGYAVDIFNEAAGTFVDSMHVIQDTNAIPIIFDGCSHLRVSGLELEYNGTAPAATRDAVMVRANTTADCLNPQIRNLTVRSSTGQFRSALYMSTRTTSRSMTNIIVNGVMCSGSATNGVYLSFGSGSNMDTQPMISGINNIGGTRAIHTVDANDSAITTIFPIIGGSRGDITLSVGGNVSPEGNVVALQGSRHIQKNGNSTTEYFKSTGTGSVGWTAITIP